jgi:alkylation response protein AidB-like acyl-CoA dehydrogenase
VRTARLGAAKFLISHAALDVCGESIQLHGGIGMTDEYSVGHYFKRAVVGSVLVGTNADHEARCAAALTLRCGVNR